MDRKGEKPEYFSPLCLRLCLGSVGYISTLGQLLQTDPFLMILAPSEILRSFLEIVYSVDFVFVLSFSLWLLERMLVAFHCC